MELKCGVIIIGSLMWDKKSDREKWRKESLIIDDKVHVFLPIRYGRESNNPVTGRIYTMVYSSECVRNRKYGTGYVIPFVDNNFKDLEQIKKVAKRLSLIEGNKDDKIVKGKKEPWCTISFVR